MIFHGIMHSCATDCGFCGVITANFELEMMKFVLEMNVSCATDCVVTGTGRPFRRCNICHPNRNHIMF